MSERCTKHTKYERFVNHFLQINRKEENVLNLYVLFSFVCVIIHLYCYCCYFYYSCCGYYHIVKIIVIIIIFIIIIIIIIGFYVVTICFIFDGARLWRGLEVWQISGDVKNEGNGEITKLTSSSDEGIDKHSEI